MKNNIGLVLFTVAMLFLTALLDGFWYINYGFRFNSTAGIIVGVLDALILAVSLVIFVTLVGNSRRNGVNDEHSRVGPQQQAVPSVSFVINNSQGALPVDIAEKPHLL